MGRSILSQKVPQHVAIIMDGNGRWAQQKGLPRTAGHRAGVDAIKPILRACAEKGISALSVWAFSLDNWARPAQEVEYLLQLFVSSLEKELTELHENGIRLQFIGDRSGLSEVLRQAMGAAESLTAANDVTILNVVINYTGRWDILQATKKIARQAASGSISIEDINEEMFTQNLATASLPEPDLFIRTSGEKRISNFFLWQLAYTEMYFTNTSWPDFTVQDFIEALASFNDRERRFGKTSAQLIGSENV